MIKLTRSELVPGVGLTIAHTDKFKSGCLSVHLIDRLSRQTAAMGALLPIVLLQGTADFPDEGSIAAAAAEFGAPAPAFSLDRIGELQDIGLCLTFPDDIALSQRPHVVEKAAELLGQILLSPRRTGGRLHGAYVDKAKERLAAIRSSRGDVYSRSARCLLDRMCPAEAYGADIYGSDSGIQRASVGTLTPYYRRLISSARIELFYCGSVDEGLLLPILRGAFSALRPRELGESPAAKVRYAPLKDLRYFDEISDSTACVAIGYRMGDAMRKPEPAAFAVLEALLGDTGLPYDVMCSIDDLKGVMLLGAASEAADCSEILSQLRGCVTTAVNGGFSHEQLAAAKASAAAKLNSVSDDPSLLCAFVLHRLAAGHELLPGDLAALVTEVTADDISRIARGIKEDAVLCMQPEV